MLKEHDAADIWRTIWLRAIASQPETSRLCPFVFQSWKEDIATVARDPEAADRFLLAANRAFAESGTRLLVLFDALDCVADSWKDIDELTTALLRTALQFSTFSHIKGKIFLREDHFNRLSFTFPDASKLLATRLELTWKRAELYGLLWKHLCNAEEQGGKVLRKVFTDYLPNSLDTKDGFWLFNRRVDLSDETLRPLFHALTGPSMGKDRRRGIPYVWTVGHLADTRQQASPRSFLAAIRRACEDSLENYREGLHAIHYESIKRGVQYASEIRVNEMKEDYPWAVDLLALLKGLMLPCSFEDVQTLWEKEFPQGPKKLVDKYPVHTPPEFASQHWQDVRKLLERLGFCMTLGDGRFNMPDLYRVCFRLGRRGGVKPLP